MLEISKNNLQAAALSAGISQTELAKKSKIIPARISQLLKRGGFCRIGTISRLANALGVEPAHLILKGGD